MTEQANDTQSIDAQLQHALALLGQLEKIPFIADMIKAAEEKVAGVPPTIREQVIAETTGDEGTPGLYKGAVTHRFLQAAKERTDEILKRLNVLFDWHRTGRMPDIMNQERSKGAKYEGVGTVSITSDAHVRIVGDKNKAYAWLEENGHADLVIAHVWPQTLKKLAKELYLAGALPEEHIALEPFQRVSIRKPPKKKSKNPSKPLDLV